jgi:hypothetical protein
MIDRGNNACIATAVRTDTVLFLELTKALLDAGTRVRFRAGGSSMYPAIRHADHVTVAPVDTGIMAGDVLLCRQRRGPTVHRVIGLCNRAEFPPLLLRGDNADRCDPPVASTHVLGRVIVTRRGCAERSVARRPFVGGLLRTARAVRGIASHGARAAFPRI